MKYYVENTEVVKEEYDAEIKEALEKGYSFFEDSDFKTYSKLYLR